MVGKGYRPDIDGLRAVAVLCVVFYHVGYGAFSGGYVGVDVFFVISGFLITRLIRDEIGAGTFRYSTFYVRRARRLFPAMFVTLGATFLAGVLLFGPADLERLSRSVVYTVLSASNFLFWWESGYFDAAAETKPLLHTWSLSVEEQFYMLWPITLVGLTWVARRVSRRHPLGGGWIVPAFLLAGGAASLAATEMTIRTDAAAAFYLVPFRITEFAIGALMVWLVAYPPRSRVVLEPLVPAGLALIAYPVFAYSGETVFPGYAALPPCLGTALLIYAGTAARAGRLLSNRIAVGIGLISYSLYLVHWPIIVFYRNWVYRPLEPVEQAAIVVASIVVATGMYFVVELPFRRAIRRSDAWSPGRFALACVVLAGVLIYPAGAAWHRGGWSSRLPEEIRSAVSDLDRKQKLSWKPIREIDKKTGFHGDGAGGGAKILVVGDSYAKDFTNALLSAEARSGQPLDLMLHSVSYYCQPFIGPRKKTKTLTPRLIRLCNKRMNALVSGTLIDEADVIVFSVRWTELGLDHIAETVGLIRARTDTPIVLLGRPIEFESVPELLVKFGRTRRFGSFAAQNRIENAEINDRLARIAGKTGVRYRSKGPLVCPEDDHCDVLDDEDRLLIYDYGHWTLEGAEFYGNRMADSGYLDAILD